MEIKTRSCRSHGINSLQKLKGYNKLSFIQHSSICYIFVLRAFTFLIIYFSTNALNSNNLENVSSFFRMKKFQHFCEKSSIKITKHLCLAVEVVEKAPQTLEWILSRTTCTLLSQSWNVDFVYLPKVHPLHTSYFSSAPLGRHVVINCIIFRAP